jgi:transposase
MRSRRPFTLIKAGNSDDTVACLRQLLQEAERGEVVGVAYCAMLRRREYVINVCGEAHRSPTFTRGMVAALDDHLADLTQPPAPA